MHLQYLNLNIPPRETGWSVRYFKCTDILSALLNYLSNIKKYFKIAINITNIAFSWHILVLIVFLELIIINFIHLSFL